MCPGRDRVFYRGRVPCEILFVGEAAGDCEAAVREPFQPNAPAGGVLTKIINQCCPNRRYLIANTVACVPYVDNTKTFIGAPKLAEIEACSPRIAEIIELAKPSYIIALGKPAARQLAHLDLEFLALQHPSSIARQKDRGAVDLKRCILNLKEYIS